MAVATTLRETIFNALEQTLSLHFEEVLPSGGVAIKRMLVRVLDSGCHFRGSRWRPESDGALGIER